LDLAYSYYVLVTDKGAIRTGTGGSWQPQCGTPLICSSSPEHVYKAVGVTSDITPQTIIATLGDEKQRMTAAAAAFMNNFNIVPLRPGDCACCNMKEGSVTID
jgi:hypothetical protein